MVPIRERFFDANASLDVLFGWLLERGFREKKNSQHSISHHSSESHSHSAPPPRLIPPSTSNLFSVISPHPEPCIASEKPWPRTPSHPSFESFWPHEDEKEPGLVLAERFECNPSPQVRVKLHSKHHRRGSWGYSILLHSSLVLGSIRYPVTGPRTIIKREGSSNCTWPWEEETRRLGKEKRREKKKRVWPVAAETMR